MLKAVLFDVDDTLLDWSKFNGVWAEIESPHLQSVYEYMLSLHPVEFSANRYIDEYMRRVQDAWMSGRHSLRSPHAGRLLIDTAIALGVPDDLLNIDGCLTAYAWKAVSQTTVFPDVPPMLEKLRDRGIRFGLVTNSFHPIFLRDVELKEHGLLEYFPECRLTAADVGYLKPHPNIFKAALDCLGVQPYEAVFVGDHPVADIAGAQSAGIMGILRVKRPPVPMISGLIVPDAAINTFDELPAKLDQLFPGEW